MAYIKIATFDTSRPVRPPVPQIVRRARRHANDLSGWTDDLGSFFNTAMQGFTTYKMADLQVRQADAQARLARAKAESDMRKAEADMRVEMLARQQSAKVSGTISALSMPVILGSIAIGGWILLRGKRR